MRFAHSRDHRFTVCWPDDNSVNFLLDQVFHLGDLASYVTTCVAKMAIKDPRKPALTQRAPDVECLREQIWPDAK